MDKKRIHDLELLSDLSEITETDFLIIDDENEKTSKKISALMLKDALIKPIISPEVAEIGQTIVVKEIDTKGKPIVWEAINLPDNNINYIETDPTVPEWAKQPHKPEYTAEEVGALPDDTEIPSLEGLATERYVNDKISEIEIPEIDLSGYATEEYVDNAVADKITIPATAEIGQTIAVKEIDENGKPTMWEAVDLPNNSGGDIQSGNDWKLLADVTLAEDVDRASIFEDIEGNNISEQGFEEIYITYEFKGKEGYSNRYSDLYIWFEQGYSGGHNATFSLKANGYDRYIGSIYAILPKKQHVEALSTNKIMGLAFSRELPTQYFICNEENRSDDKGLTVAMQSVAGIVAGSRIIVYGR